MANGQLDSAPPMSESLGMPASMAAGQPPVQPQPAAQPVQPVQPAEPPQHHNALAGALIALAGPDIVHSVDSTGKITATPVPPSPGSAFRKILAGALTGMGAGAAAGAQGHPGAGILGGIGAGGTAVMAQQRAQNQQDIQNQQTQFENQQKSQLQQATLALHNAEMLNQRRNVQRMDAEDALKVQNSNEKFADLVTGKSGEVPPIVVGGEDINGKPGNWEAMRAHFTNPDNVKPPEGYHYVYNTTYDYSGLHREGNQWVDENSNPVDINSRASEIVGMVPNAKLNETHKISRDEFQTMSGFPLPKSFGDSIDMSTADMIGMHTKNVQGQNAALKIQVSQDIAQERIAAENARAQVRLDVANGKLTASTRTMLEAAPRVISFVDRIDQLVDQQVKTLGPAASRWNEFMAGKVGAPNPEFTKLRTNVGLLSTALMRMHVGARGGEQIMRHFQDLIDSSKQSPENMKAALGEIKAYAQELQQEGQGGGAAAAPTNQTPAQPKGGNFFTNFGGVQH